MATQQFVFAPFDTELDSQSAGPRWKKWLTRFDNYLVAMDITAPARQKALLLHFAGERVADIYETIKDEDEDYETVKAKLTTHFAPQVNVQYEIYLFRTTKQEASETVDQYCTRLRTLATTCEFTDTDKEIHSQIIQTCCSQEVRRRALRDPKLTLPTLLTLARTLEASDRQATGMQQTAASTAQAATVNAISSHQKSEKSKKKWGKPRHGKQHGKPGPKKSQSTSQCWNCGGQWPHSGGREACPAHGKTCGKCGKSNHYGQYCRQTKPVNAVHQDTGENADLPTPKNGYVFTISALGRENLPRTLIKINGTEVSTMIDSGSSVNIIDEVAYEGLHPKPILNTHAPRCRITGYGSTVPIPIIGSFTTELELKDRFSCATIHVVSGGSGSLLGYATAVDLGLLHITNSITPEPPPSLVSEYQDIFKGIGKLKDFQIRLHIDKSVEPVKQTHRRIPFHIRQQVEDELKTLEKQDIIEEVTGPTPWVSPIVAAPKPKAPSQIRICIDMREANRAIQRERHISPTIDDLIHDLNGATIFSHLDLKAGYHQLEIHPDSRYITTFSTHLGLRRYKRLIFGISSASEIFQHTIAEILDGIPGVRNISDDIIVFGKGRTKQDAQQAHDAALREVFRRMRERGLTFNPEKCEFNRPTLEYYGHIFGEAGLSPAPSKVEAVNGCPPPTNASEVRSLLGMGNFCSRYLQNYADMVKPLRDLTKQDVDWIWGSAQQQALSNLKRALTSRTTMAYFDAEKHTEVFVDASPSGLGAVLTQKAPGTKNTNRKVIAYGSRALSDVESRYSQTEREALAVYWAICHFHLYLYGDAFTIVTDHKPLEGVFNKPNSKPPARIERWLLKLQQYNFDTRYEPGRFNPADYMSRHLTPADRRSVKVENPADEYVRYLAENAAPKSLTLSEIQQETLKDNTLRTVTTLIRSGQWYKAKDSEVIQFFNRVRDELTVTDDANLIMRDHRIVIPESLQQRVVNLAHEGHQGIVKTKALLREKVWFPRIDQMTETVVKNCLACQATTPEPRPYQPLQTGEMPTQPWTHLAADFYGPINNAYLLVVVDEHSRYPIVETCSTTSAEAVIPILDRMFAMMGTPRVLKTDNGPPWSSHRMAQFADYLGFTHRRITPYWPQANSEAERFMRVLGKTLQSAKISGRPFRQELTSMLRNYRATPHSTTGVAPATLLLGRVLKVKIPDTFSPPTDNKLIARNQQKKEKMNDHISAQRHTRPRHLQLGDFVFVKQEKRDKTTSPYEPAPYKVTHRNGSSITARNIYTGRTTTRNISFFKSIPPPTDRPQHTERMTPLDDLGLEPEAAPPPEGAPPQPEVAPRRNPARARNQPAHFGEYDMY